MPRTRSIGRDIEIGRTACGHRLKQAPGHLRAVEYQDQYWGRIKDSLPLAHALAPESLLCHIALLSTRKLRWFPLSLDRKRRGIFVQISLNNLQEELRKSRLSRIDFTAANSKEPSFLLLSGSYRWKYSKRPVTTGTPFRFELILSS
jgi:hypothetical protein